jgi:hypothetical protein
MNNHGERMPIIDGLKSIPYGREIKLVTHPPYAITVAYYSNPKRKNMDLIHRDRSLVSDLKPTFAHVSGPSRVLARPIG